MAITITETVSASGDDGDIVDNSFSSTKVNLEVGVTMAMLNSRLFVRFDSVPIPPGSTINSALIRFEADEANTDAFDTTIQADDSDNPSTYSSSSDVTSATLTSQSTSWTTSSFSEGDMVDTASIVSVVQEIIDRSGWANNNAMIFHIQYDGASMGEEFVRFSAEDHTADIAPRLRVTYTPPKSGGMSAVHLEMMGLL